MKHTLPIGAMLALSGTTAIAEDRTHPDHHIDEEIVVSAPFQRTTAQTALPVHRLVGENYRKSASSSLGDTLDGLPGVHNSSFGPGVGRAVIRGQSGNRVQVLANSLANVDVSAISPDHANSVEPVIATGVEVIRGPATLLYGNGAVGGIVNVLDNRIPEQPNDGTHFAFEQSHNSVNDENRSVAKLDTALGGINLHLDGATRDSNRVNVPGRGPGYIENSDAEADSFTFGASVTRDWGFAGFSVNNLQSDYGLPPGSHAHDDDHEDEGDEESIRIDMEQVRYDFKAGWNPQNSLITGINFGSSYTDYEHDELEIEGDSAIVGTRFINNGSESRLTLEHAPVGNWLGTWGVQLGRSEFSAIGEEAFIPKTDRDNIALFIVEALETGNTTWELGARVERTELDPGGNCDSDNTTTSFSASALREISVRTNLYAAVSRSERAPTLEERYSNIDAGSCTTSAELIVHAATGLLEIGNPELDEETSNNFELGIRLDDSHRSLELNIFYNAIDDYIYLEEIGETPMGEVAGFQSEDATFYGLEGRYEGHLLDVNAGSLDFVIQGDLVRAGFDRGGDVPRIPPARISAGLNFSGDRWNVELNATRVFKQDRIGTHESETNAYTNLELYADYHFAVAGAGDIQLFVRGTNLLDEEIRSHTSFLKEFAPEPGLGIRAGFHFSF